MIVFEYLYGMMNIFGPLMDEYAMGKKKLVDSTEVCHIQKKFIDPIMMYDFFFIF